MEVDETMITGHLDHARFSGVRFGRILNLLSRSHSVFRTAGALELSPRMLPGESRSQTSQERVGCGLQGRPPAGIVHEARESAQGTSVFLAAAEPQQKGQAMEPVRAAFFQKRSITGALRGSNPGKLKKIIFLLPTRFLFHARFRFERRNPRLERRCLDPFVTGVPP